MQTRRVTVVVTARPSYARIQTALAALQAQGTPFDVVCVASANVTRYGNVAAQIASDGFPVSRVIHTQLDGDDPSVLARTMGLTTLDLAAHFSGTQPLAVVTIADRAETLATAVAASYQHIPLVHVQGGEVTGSIDDKVRHAITQLADLHLVSHESAAACVRSMRPGAHVLVTGCPSIDLARAVTGTVQELPGTGPQIDLSKPFLLVLFHPVTDEAEDATRQMLGLKIALNQMRLPVVWFWPNPDTGTEAIAKSLRRWTPLMPVHQARQVPPEAFIRLMKQCAVMVGNSSAGIREGSALGVPVVNIGSRQQGRLRGTNVIDTPPMAGAITRGIEQWLNSTRPAPQTLYGDGTAGVQIASALRDWLIGRATVRHVA